MNAEPAAPAAAAPPAALEVSGLSLAYGGHGVLEDISFRLEQGAIGCLLGPSGSGKTTLLRAVAGFDTPRAGHIALAGRCVADAVHALPPEARRVGMVFQDHALFPHLSVAGNIAFGIAALARPAREARIAELLAMLDLSPLAARYPHELSGGQQQRVALARALAPRPGILLLDEPFSNLDADLRERLGRELRGLLKSTGTTALLVTHDQHEAFAMADMVGVINRGRLVQWASPHELYHRPADRFVANFIGEGVLLPARVTGPHTVQCELGVLYSATPLACRTGADVDVLIRPDDIQHDDASPHTVNVEERLFRGAEFLYTLRLPSGQRLLSLVPSHHRHEVGSALGIRLEVDDLILFAG
ncbi:MAG: ABC transporter ATP-binding protein [Rhodocyclaceae bacterium]|nr:ABC transporter ATP-binding protein [Rhodocyclaceae bacterium]